MVEELKPCPFCQSKVEAVSGNNLRTGGQIDSGFMFECENLHTFEIPFTKEVNSWEAAFSVFNHTPSAPLPEEVDAAIDGMTDVLAEAVSQTPCENVNEVKRRFNKNMDVIRANMRHQAAEIERLKGALKFYADCKHVTESDYLEMGEIAKQALKKGDKHGQS